MDREEFLKPSAAYRGVVLWMLNDRLEKDEIARQIEGIHTAGWGTVIPRTFNGLRTRYLSDEWMEMTQTIVGLCAQRGMKVWLQAGYMPGGIPDLPVEHAHRGLFARSGEERNDGDEVLAKDDRYTYVLRTEKNVVDLLNPQAVDAYLEKAYVSTWEGRFGKEFGKTIEGIWVDEPHFRPPLLPWSAELPEVFRKLWGYDIANHLPELFRPTGDYRKVRHHYWRTVSALFVAHYFRRVHRWCGQHKLKFSGHLMGEDTLADQISWTGDAMPCYAEMDVPGIDHLTMSLIWPSRKKFITTPKQCSSAAEQFGRDEILCEMYGVSSSGITFADRREIANWMLLHGVNQRCYHGAFYSLRGRRKRIYVPALSYQQPWWSDNRLIADQFSRLCYVLRQGRAAAELLVIHNVESGFCIYDALRNLKPHDRVHEPEDIARLHTELTNLCDNLEQIQRTYHLASEATLAYLGRVTQDGLAVGNLTYCAVILPAMLTIRGTTLNILRAFRESGGTVLLAGNPPELLDGSPSPELLESLARYPRVDNSPQALKKVLDETVPPLFSLAAEGNADAVRHILVQARRTDEGLVCFLGNVSRTTPFAGTLRIRGKGKVERWNASDGTVTLPPQEPEEEAVAVQVDLAPLSTDLLLLRFSQPPVRVARLRERITRVVEIPCSFRLKRDMPNALTLDVCRWRTPQTDWSEQTPVIAVHGKLTAERYRGPVSLRFAFRAASVPSKICAVIEDAAQYEIAVNGARVCVGDLPYYIDRSFHPVDITHLVREGENSIELTGEFTPLPPARFSLASLFETQEGTELESIYLIGDFAVKGTVVPDPGDPKCVRYRPDFVLDSEEAFCDGNLTSSGYPFYAGRATLSAEVTLPPAGAGEKVFLQMPSLDAALARVRVNGKEASPILWEPLETDITHAAVAGLNTVEIELVGTLRNLLGPHHRLPGEPDNCWSTAFNYTPPAQQRAEHPEEGFVWTDEYSFLHFGVRGTIRIVYRACERA